MSASLVIQFRNNASFLAVWTLSASLLLGILVGLRRLSRMRKERETNTNSRGGDEIKLPFLSNIVPFKGLPIYDKPEWPRCWKAGKYQLTMGLRKLDPDNWMTFDNQWEIEHKAKLEYASRKDKETIVDYLDGEDEAAVELLEVIVTYITRRYPDMFCLEGDQIIIIPIGERYRIKAPYDRHPLETASLLVMDDLYILKQGEGDLYYLRGAFLAAPTGWRLDQKIGWPLHQIHDPVPLWKEKLKKSMERFFVNLKVNSPIQRNNLFVQPCGEIFHHDRFESYPEVKRIEDLWIRTELQSLCRLPRSKAVVFSVRTYMAKMTELKEEPAALERLWDAVRNFPDIVSEYKSVQLWKDVFEAFCREELGKNEPEIDANTRDGVTTAYQPKACPAGFT
ncbi:uncharacterized protein F4822DRAFT_155737 [Hypoxylon trugodes]|uniref:uncharacterized protein n=1 Tax=Hypoxylon trugodes TaxID=326681 RepID=UPI00219B1834|nr:uncharacterized protein F4822DRAFT_155737 [Hypoxylon trugodes]KAI1390613.1 hypothetical protein F4822DRAFT_155737 [Hypoxylon trugodes]